MRTVRFSPSARRDLAEITAHLVDAAGRAIATEVVLRLRSKCDLLAETPGELGTARPELGAAIRSFPVSPHVLFFRYPCDELVEVIRILHERQDVKSQEIE